MLNTGSWLASLGVTTNMYRSSGLGAHLIKRVSTLSVSSVNTTLVSITTDLHHSASFHILFWASTNNLPYIYRQLLSCEIVKSVGIIPLIINQDNMFLL